MFVKICGVKTEAAVRAAVESGADAIGFVFAPSSRQIDVKTAQALTVHIPDSIRIVGVFLNPAMEEIETAIQAGITDLQIHHRTLPMKRLTSFGLPVIEAAEETDAAIQLLDAPMPGSGEPLTWEKLSRPKRPFWLAGGLTPGNVGQAIRLMRPDGVDVSSGVETDGVKDPEKIRAFIQRAKEEAICTHNQ